jgi:hypothetical protein
MSSFLTVVKNFDRTGPWVPEMSKWIFFSPNPKLVVLEKGGLWLQQDLRQGWQIWKHGCRLNCEPRRRKSPRRYENNDASRCDILKTRLGQFLSKTSLIFFMKKQNWVHFVDLDWAIWNKMLIKRWWTLSIRTCFFTKNSNKFLNLGPWWKILHSGMKFAHRGNYWFSHLCSLLGVNEVVNVQPKSNFTPMGQTASLRGMNLRCKKWHLQFHTMQS